MAAFISNEREYSLLHSAERKAAGYRLKRFQLYFLLSGASFKVHLHFNSEFPPPSSPGSVSVPYSAEDCTSLGHSVCLFVRVTTVAAVPSDYVQVGVSCLSPSSLPPLRLLHLALLGKQKVLQAGNCLSR